MRDPVAASHGYECLLRRPDIHISNQRLRLMYQYRLFQLMILLFRKQFKANDTLITDTRARNKKIVVCSLEVLGPQIREDTALHRWCVVEKCYWAFNIYAINDALKYYPDDESTDIEKWADLEIHQ
jgi:hypothetical protein